MRAPVGTLRLIVNWPASVRGKNATPSNGYNPRLATNSPISPATVNQGHRSASLTDRSYRSSSLLNFALNRAVNRTPHEACASRTVPSSGVAPGPLWECTPFRNRAQKSGMTVIATKYEAKSEMTTARASAENRNLLTPYRKVTGKNTTTVVSVAASTAMLTSAPPASAAASGVAPISR
jgi:hypothetical protein